MQGSVNIGGLPAALGLAILSSGAGTAAGCGDQDCITCGKQPKPEGSYPDIKSFLEKAGFDIAKSPDATVIGIRITPVNPVDGEGTTAASDVAGQTVQTDEAALESAVREHAALRRKVQQETDQQVLDFISDQLRREQLAAIDVEHANVVQLGKPLDYHQARIDHLRNLRELFKTRLAIS